jgi:hypothetical protein
MQPYVNSQSLAGMHSAQMLQAANNQAALDNLLHEVRNQMEFARHLATLDQQVWTPGRKKTNIYQDRLREAKAQWEKMFGKLDDPEMARRIREQAKLCLQGA